MNIFMTDGPGVTAESKADVDKPGTETEDHFVSQIHCQSKKPNYSQILIKRKNRR
jgi:hypothetical protein